MASRILDILVSLFGLIILLIMLPVIALLIKLDSPGPIFYKGLRVGRNGRLFSMYKFRTMYETPQFLGASVSPVDDPRVTPVGQFLRRTKLNEFPQFFNVLKGDMALIGPRPESPDLAAAYPPEARKIFAVKPGVAGPNQILGRNEEDFYPPGSDARTYYLEHLLPKKIVADLEYVEKKSLWLDLKYLFLSVWVTISGAIGRRHLTDNFSQIMMLVGDIVCCLLSFAIAHLIRFEGLGRQIDFNGFIHLLPFIVLLRIPLFIYFGFYHVLVRYFGIYDIKQIAKGVATSSVLLILYYFFALANLRYSRSVLIIDPFLLTFLLVGYRDICKRWRLRTSGKVADDQKVQALIWGAGELGQLCLRYLKISKNPPYEVVGFIDENHKLRRRRIDGCKVLGNHHHLEILAQLYKIQEIYIAQPPPMPPALYHLEDLSCRLSITLKHFWPENGNQISDQVSGAGSRAMAS